MKKIRIQRKQIYGTAIQYTGENADEVMDFLEYNESHQYIVQYPRRVLSISDPRQERRQIKPGEWAVREPGIAGWSIWSDEEFQNAFTQEREES